MNSDIEAKLIAPIAQEEARSDDSPRGPAPMHSGIGSTSPLAYDELLHFFTESRDLLCIAGFDGRFKSVNPAWQQTLGWTAEELRSRPFLDFVLPEHRPATMLEMGKLAAGHATITFENRYRCKDGSCKWLQWTAQPLPELQEIYAIARDVTRQKELEEQILETLDRERERMGRELHDGLCQDLAAVASLSSTLVGRLAPAAGPESVTASAIVTMLGQAIQHARDLARGFDPLHLETIGLQAALQKFCANTTSLFNVTCRLSCNGCLPSADPSRGAHLYRIAQEAVHNAIAHGQAKRIEIIFACQNGQGRLAIQDDGVGFDQDAERIGGIGLHTMEYRARTIGAVLEITSRSPRGTVVACVFPLVA